MKDSAGRRLGTAGLCSVGAHSGETARDAQACKRLQHLSRHSRKQKAPSEDEAKCLILLVLMAGIELATY